MHVCVHSTACAQHCPPIAGSLSSACSSCGQVGSLCALPLDELKVQGSQALFGQPRFQGHSSPALHPAGIWVCSLQAGPNR